MSIYNQKYDIPIILNGLTNNLLYLFINISMKNLTPEMVACLGTSIAIELAKCKSTDELQVIRNLASQIAATLFTIISQRTFLEKEAQNTTKKDTTKTNSKETDKSKT